MDYAIKGNLLDGYFKSQKMEVMNMSLTEFNQEEYDRNRRREGEEIGFERGERSGKQKTARNMLATGLGSLEQIAQVTGLPITDIEKLAARP